jgi:SPP1 gp7 family putative phage head morphogenesis protein
MFNIAHIDGLVNMKLAGIQYNVQLQRMVRALKRDIDAEIVPLLKQLAPEYIQDAGWSDVVAGALKRLLDRWTSPFSRRVAQDIADKFVKSATTTPTGQTSFGIDIFQNSQQLQDYLSAASWQNSQLITSIPVQYIDQVSNIVMGNMRQGMRPSYIEKALQQQFGVTQRRAKMIARDQTAKVTGEIAKQRQQGAGFQYFRWVDSHDQRVRHRHREIANKMTEYGKGVYRWDDLPLSDKGEPIQPGSDYQCRCVAVAASNSAVEKYRREQKG